MRSLLALVVLALAACGGPPTGSASGSDKLDLALRSALADRERTASDEPLSVLLRLDAPPDDARRAALVDAGLDVGTEAGDVVVVSGPAEAVREAVRLPFVQSAELSQRRRISP